MYQIRGHQGAVRSTVVNNFDVKTSKYLYNLSEDYLTEIILGEHPDAKMADDQWQLLLEIGARTWQIVAHEPELAYY